jgi:hypothetical protein
MFGGVVGSAQLNVLDDEEGHPDGDIGSSGHDVEFRNSVPGVGLSVPGDNDGIVFEEEPEVIAINGSKLQYDVFDPNDHASSPGQNIEFSSSVMASQPDKDMSVCDASHSEMLSNSYGNVMFGDEMEFVQMDVLDDDDPSGHDVDFENRLVGVISLLLQSESSP